MIFKKKVPVLVLALLLLILLPGCASRTENELKTAVNEYNKTLMAVLSSGSIDLLSNVATDNEVRRMQLFLNNLNEEKKIISAELQSFNFTGVPILKPPSNKEAEANEAKVKTVEIWNYKYLDPGTKNITEGPYRIKYNATYHVVKDNNKWVVNDVYFQEEVLK